MRGGAVAARRAHNPKVAGSSPAPATWKTTMNSWSLFLRSARKHCPAILRLQNSRCLFVSKWLAVSLSGYDVRLNRHAMVHKSKIGILTDHAVD